MSDRTYQTIFDDIMGNPMEQVAVLEELAADMHDLNAVFTSDGLVDISDTNDNGEY